MDLKLKKDIHTQLLEENDDPSENDENIQDFDEVLEHIGEYGKYQLQWFAIIVAGMLSGSFVNYSLYYFTLSPVYDCIKIGATEYSKCTKEDICSKVVINSQVPFKVDYSSKFSIHNWIEQYHLECASDYDIGLIGSSFFVGTFVGSFVLPRLGDVYGRKPMFLVGLVIYIGALFGLLFSTSLSALYFLLVLCGIGETGRYYVAYVYVIEIFPVKHQSLVGLCIFLSFSVSKVIICCQFMWLNYRTWTYCCYTALLLAFISLFVTIFALPESPRWLYSKKDYARATETLLRVQAKNGKDLEYKFNLGHKKVKEPEDSIELVGLRPEAEQTNENAAINGAAQVENDEQLSSLEEEQLQGATIAEHKLKGTYKELCQNKLYVRNLSIMMFVWSFGSFAFFLVPFYVAQVKIGNVYDMILCSECAEFLASAICIYISRVMRLKNALTLFSVMITIGATAMCILVSTTGGTQDKSSRVDILTSVFILFTNLGVVCVFDIAYLINPQLFPTILLATCYGACNIVGRFVTIFSPLAARLGRTTPLVLLIVFSAACAMCSRCLVVQKKVKVKR